MLSGNKFWCNILSCDVVLLVRSSEGIPVCGHEVTFRGLGFSNGWFSLVSTISIHKKARVVNASLACSPDTSTRDVTNVAHTDQWDRGYGFLCDAVLRESTFLCCVVHF